MSFAIITELRLHCLHFLRAILSRANQCRIEIKLVLHSGTYQTERGRTVHCQHVRDRTVPNAYPKNTLMSSQDISFAVKLSLARRVNVVRKAGRDATRSAQDRKESCDGITYRDR